MFEITDEFINQAGFTMISPERREAMKQRSTVSVERRIATRLAAELGEDDSDVLMQVIDGDSSAVGQVLAQSPGYQDDIVFQETQQLGKANNASDDEILQQYAIVVIMQGHKLNLAEIVQEAMNEEMVYLQSILAEAIKAVEE